MPYNVNYTDSNTKTPVTVYDNTSNTDTSLTFPGRNVTGYGQIIAENFLHLLENFASPTQPANPIEGQLWYDSSTGTLNIYDNISWKSSSGIQKAPSAPSVSADKVGEVWVDTVKQQLYVWSGATWVLVGPNFSTESGLRTGPIIETIDDSDNNPRNVVKFLVDDVPVSILSKDSFTPKVNIPGFDTIRAGLNISNPTDAATIANFEGGFLPKINGTASSADALTVSGTVIESGKFLRTDIVNTTEYGLNIRNNSGLTLGVDGTFRLLTSVNSAKIYNGTAGASIDIQVNREGTASTTVRIINDTVGVNVLDPQQALDVDGNFGLTGNIIVSNTDASTNFNNGSIRTQGGAAISKNLLVGGTLSVSDVSTLENTLPSATDTYDLGSTSRRWSNVYAGTVTADYLRGVLDGDVAGNARTATNLRSVTSFALTGDVTSNTVNFDGAVGGNSKSFVTELTTNIIEGKNEPFPNTSTKNDYVLVFRSGSGLLKESRNTFVGDLAVPIGAILPFAGSNVPDGYLLCDGSEVERSKYNDLYDVIGSTYGVTSIGVNTFKLPDLRGRFPLGRDNMDNGGSVPTISGSPVDAGGGTAGRVSGTSANTLGGAAGSSTNTLDVSNIPNHTHNMKAPGTDQQFAAVKVGSTVVSGVSPGPGLGPTAPGQAQYLNSSGNVNASSTNQPFSIMNPYLTINYIIRSGPPAF